MATVIVYPVMVTLKVSRTEVYIKIGTNTVFIAYYGEVPVEPLALKHTIS